MGNFLRYVITVLFVLIVSGAGAQTTIEALRQEIQKAEEEIRRNNELLEKTVRDRQVNQTQLKLILSRIGSRKEVIGSLQKQINLLQDQISEKDRSVAEMTSQLEKLREEYAIMVREAYKNSKLNNFALFLFAAEDFNDATRRIDYMRRYNSAREARARQLKELADSLSAEIDELNARREELDGTRTSHGRELENLGRDERQYRTSVAQLQQQESKIAKEVKARQQQIDNAQKEIERLIAEEARKDRNETRTAAQDRYITELSGKFEDNRGKLPYPVRGGVITDRYGTHPHPTQRGLTINNKGVNISADRGSDVTCVFEGDVSRVFAIPGYNNCVLVRHGNYYSLYANLASVSVKPGDRIALNQRVGRLSDSTNSDDVYLHFEVWKDTTHLNPEQWIRR